MVGVGDAVEHAGAARVAEAVRRRTGNVPTIPALHPLLIPLLPLRLRPSIYHCVSLFRRGVSAAGFGEGDFAGGAVVAAAPGGDEAVAAGDVAIADKEVGAEGFGGGDDWEAVTSVPVLATVTGAGVGEGAEGAFATKVGGKVDESGVFD